MATKEKRKSAVHASAPFGAPDGATGDLNEVEDHFIEVEHRLAPAGFDSGPEERMARVFVGKKGVGKTTYLRRLQASASGENSVFAAAREHSPPSTDDVVTVSGLFGRDTLVETWQLIWRRAIQRSVVTKLLHQKQLKPYLSDEVADALSSGYSHIVPSSRVPRPVYAEVGSILRATHTRYQLADYLRHDSWAELEHWIGEAMSDAPPIYMYIDAVDDHFQQAPMYWLQCQKGLFLEAIGLQSSDVGHRLHVVVSVRDLVFSSVLRSELASRYRSSPHVRLLEWDYRSIRFFLHEKIRRLDPDFRMRTTGHDVSDWLGRTTIPNEARGVSENVEDYLLRHTRLIPRDIVELGNILCHEVRQAKADKLRAVPAETLRRIVGSSARGFANEQIRVCANQIASDEIPELGGLHRSSEFFIGSDEYATQRARDLLELLGQLPGDRFDTEACQRLAEAGKRELNHNHLLDVLWQNGVLGYDSTEPNATHADFYAATDADLFHLPRDKPRYVLHPSIPHLIHMKHLGEVPVRGFRKGANG
ncbi:MAG TPA: hypothetical protein VHW96_20400 [Solirubrobacteraceae bacterium]|nr:hypothetical protein [Solirubrobacteraceae bacterium]